MLKYLRCSLYFSALIICLIYAAADTAIARDLQTQYSIAGVRTPSIGAVGAALKKYIVSDPATAGAWAGVVSNAHAAKKKPIVVLPLSVPLEQARENNTVNEAVAKNALSAALVYSVTRDRSFGVAALNNIAACVNQFPPAQAYGIETNHAYHVLYARDWLPDIARSYDIMYAGMTPQQRKETEQWLRQMVRVIYAENTWRRWRNSTHGIWQAAALGIVASALQDDAMLKVASHRMKYLLTSVVDEEGFWPGGSLRFHYTATRAALAFAEATRVPGINAYAWADSSGESYIRKMCDAPLMCIDPFGMIPGNNHMETAPPPADIYMTANAVFRNTEYATIAHAGKDEIEPLRVVLNYRAPQSLQKWILPHPNHTIMSESLGWGMLRSWGGYPGSALFARLDFGPHGGSAGHADKLNVYLCGNGRRVTTDDDTYPQSSPLRFGWAKQTLSHNTVVLNYRSQRGAKTPGDPNGLPGKILLFDLEPRLSVIEADARNAQPHVPLTDYRRCIVLADSYFLDVFTIGSKKPVTADWVFHGLGGTVAIDNAVEGERSLNNDIIEKSLLGNDEDGYFWIDDVRTYSANEQWSVKWGSGLRTIMMGQPGTDLLVGKSGGTGRKVGELIMDRTYSQQTLIARRAHVLDTRFVAVHEIMTNDQPRVTSFARLDTGNNILVLEVMSKEWRDIFILQPTRDTKEMLVDAVHSVTVAPSRYAYIRFNSDNSVEFAKNATVKTLD